MCERDFFLFAKLTKVRCTETMITTIFFDADGVLIKSKHLFSEGLERDFGIDINKMLPFFTGVFRECGIGKADLKEELGKVIGDWGWKGTVEELMRYWFTTYTKIDEEMAEYVLRLRSRGIRVYMTTDQEKYRGENLRNALEGKMFDMIFFSSEVGRRKDTVEFWQHVYAKVNNLHATKKEEILFVDDNEDNISVAALFGLKTYLYRGDLNDLKESIAFLTGTANA